jgi:flagellar hook-length control protein FliK
VQASKSEKALATPAAPFAAPLPKATAKGTADKTGHAIPAAGAADLQPSVAAKPTQAATAADTFKPGAAPGNQDANANAQLTGGNDRTSNAKSHAGTPNKTDQASTASDPTAAGIPAAAVQAAELENTDSKVSAATTGSDSSNTKSAQPGIPLPDGASVTVARDAHHAEAAHAAQESPKEAPADTMDQIVLGLKGKFDARMGKAEIKLDPPNMGRVNVSLSLENGSLTAQFQSDSDSVRDLLRTHMDKLKSVLQAQGVAVDRLAVDSPVAQPGSSASGGGQQSSFDSATHDGRSAGQYQQNGRQQQQPAQGEAFARMFRQTQDAPFDMVA